MRKGRDRSAGAALVELAFTLVMLLLLGFGCLGYSLYFAQRTAQASAVSQTAFRVRVHCEFFPDDKVEACLKEFVDQAAASAERQRRPVTLRVSVLAVGPGGRATEVAAYAAGAHPVRWTAASFDALPADERGVFAKLGRAYVAEAWSVPFLRVPFVKVDAIYDRVVG